MVQSIVRLIILATLMHLHGCYTISDPDIWPNDFIHDDKLSSMTGMKKNEILKDLGEPSYIVFDEETKSYIYQRLEDDRALLMVGYFPFIVAPIRKGNAAHCVLLVFDIDDRLQNYILKTKGYNFMGGHPFTCIDVFRRQDEFKDKCMAIYTPSRDRWTNEVCEKYSEYKKGDTYPEINGTIQPIPPPMPP